MLTRDFRDLIGNVILDVLERDLANGKVDVKRAKEISRITTNLVTEDKDFDQLQEAIKELKEKIPEVRENLEKIENNE